MTQQFDQFQYNNLDTRPLYLIVVTGPSKKTLHYITTTKPDHLPGGITAKGFYINTEEDSAPQEEYKEIIKNTAKENIKEIFFPWHRILEVRNILFKAK
jgi:hypothetical protein